ncbi:hypothetical protein B0H14DRAFT_2599985 [Mycena olivaceomarginata]|nr:hypothetical protein B0H14DRAFT_2599985 [Mycena olivaceomarginata]
MLSKRSQGCSLNIVSTSLKWQVEKALWDSTFFILQMLNVANVLITLAPNGGVDSDDVAKVLASLGAGDDGPEADSEGSEWTPGDAVRQKDSKRCLERATGGLHYSSTLLYCSKVAREHTPAAQWMRDVLRANAGMTSRWLRRCDGDEVTVQFREVAHNGRRAWYTGGTAGETLMGVGKEGCSVKKEYMPVNRRATAKFESVPGAEAVLEGEGITEGGQPDLKVFEDLYWASDLRLDLGRACSVCGSVQDHGLEFAAQDFNSLRLGLEAAILEAGT